MAETTGARRAIEWFLGTGDQEPSDSDMIDLHCFLRQLMERIDAGEEMNLSEWEIADAGPFQDRPHIIN